MYGMQAVGDDDCTDSTRGATSAVQGPRPVQTISRVQFCLGDKESKIADAEGMRQLVLAVARHCEFCIVAVW